MSNRKKTHSGIRQNDQTVKKSQKHETNLQKNSTLYFQVGLILCLLMAYGLFEMKFETKLPNVVENHTDIDEYTIDIPIVPQAKPEIQEPVQQKKVTKPKDFEIVSNEKDIISDVLDVPDDTSSEDKNPPVDLGDIDIVEPVIPEEVPFVSVEQIPLYPGCEKKKGREAQSKCMSEKISKLIQRKFDSGLASELGLSGMQRIQVQFKIDKSGKVTEIKTRAPHPRLGKEAERVVDLIPDMKPGKQRDEPVAVRYNLPINFQVQN